MYQANGTYYTEEYSVSFGDLVTRTSGGNIFVEFNAIANTWNDWHLIPSSRPAIVHPPFVSKYIEVPGSDGMLDLTEYLTGRAVLGQRQGSLGFYVANGFENWETIRQNIVSTLHGKKMKMMLQDDPGYYYEGRFTVGNWESGADHSAISISYQLDPYKMKIRPDGSDYPTLWDPFNFETDYDYSVFYPNVTVSNETKTFDVHAYDFPFMPIITWVSGSVTVTFGGVTKTLNSAGAVIMGAASNGMNTLSISGNGSVKVYWREGAL